MNKCLICHNLPDLYAQCTHRSSLKALLQFTQLHEKIINDEN